MNVHPGPRPYPLPAEVITRLPAHEVSPGLARRFVTDAVRDAPCDDLAEDLALLTSEVVTNAFVHAGTDIELCVRLMPDGAVRVAVADADPTEPAAVLEESGKTTSGRGLAIVAALSRSWGVEKVPSGKAVWFELGAGNPD